MEMTTLVFEVFMLNENLIDVLQHIFLIINIYLTNI
jgi:hypothetical protein